MRKIIIQAALSPWPYRPEFDAGISGRMCDMLRLTHQRHAAYARAHDFDFWHVTGTIFTDMKGGGYDKIHLIRQAMEYKYDYIVWVDADAAIMDFDHDLSEALKVGEFGACMHDPAKSEFLRQHNVPPHYNIGVTYWRNTANTQRFVIDWFASYPGDKRWLEQGSFNHLIAQPEYEKCFEHCGDEWNATVGVNEVEKPIVKGWHGIWPIEKRYMLMRQELFSDFMTFRV